MPAIFSLSLAAGIEDEDSIWPGVIQEIAREEVPAQQTIRVFASESAPRSTFRPPKVIQPNYRHYSIDVELDVETPPLSYVPSSEEEERRMEEYFLPYFGWREVVTKSTLPVTPRQSVNMTSSPTGRVVGVSNGDVFAHKEITSATRPLGSDESWEYFKRARETVGYVLQTMIQPDHN